MELLALIVVTTVLSAATALVGLRWSEGAHDRLPPPPEPHPLVLADRALREDLGALWRGGGVWSLPGVPGTELRLAVRGGRATATFSVPLPCPPDVRIRPEDVLQGRDPGLDDPDFDAALHLRGAPDWLSAALGEGTRRALLRLNRTGLLALEDGVLRLAAVDLPAEALVTTARDLAAAAADLSLVPDDVPAVLRRRAASEPRGPRALAAIRLLAFHPGSEQAGELARSLQPRPWEILTALEDRAGHALDAFARAALEPAAADLVLVPLLEHRSSDVRRATVAALERLGTPRSREALARAARGPLSGPARQALAAIEGRAGPAGALSVIDDAAGGALSVVPDLRGAMAVEKES